jgi:hypothetical protein
MAGLTWRHHPGEESPQKAVETVGTSRRGATRDLDKEMAIWRDVPSDNSLVLPEGMGSDLVVTDTDGVQIPWSR